MKFTQILVRFNHLSADMNSIPASVAKPSFHAHSSVGVRRFAVQLRCLSSASYERNTNKSGAVNQGIVSAWFRNCSHSPAINQFSIPLLFKTSGLHYHSIPKWNYLHRKQVLRFSTNHRKPHNNYDDAGNTKSTQEQNMADSIVKENIVTVPNILTLSRAVLSPVLGYLVVTGAYPWALGIFIYAGITDWLDGWIARRWPSQRTVCGTVVDPIADKLLIIIFTGSLCTVNLIPGALAFLIIFKDVCMVLGGLVLRWTSIEKPVTLKKFFDFKLPSMEMKPLTISKINTALQISTLAVSLAAPVFGFVGHPALQFLWLSTGCTTIATGVGYVFAKDAYEIKSKKK